MAGIQDYLLSHVLTWFVAVQLAVGGIAFLLAYKSAAAILSGFEHHMALFGLSEESSDLRKARTFLKVTSPILFVVFLGIAYKLAHRFNWPADGLEILLTLAFGLFLMRFLAAPMTNRHWAAVLTAIIWIWVILRIFHIVHIGADFLAGIYFTAGDVRVSVLTILRAFFFSLVLYWLSKNFLILLRIWLHTKSRLPPVTQTLLYKFCAIFFFLTSVVLILHYMKIDLTLFALFGGIMGLGIGFSLRKVFTNLFSGFMILADKSIKPGDVIQLGDTYGWINFLGSRYISVVTRNGIEHLIPNDDLISNEVINWSYSNNLVRLQVHVGISYDSDLEAAMKLMLEAAADTVRVLSEPEPSCLLADFGENAINLELRVWINDPQIGIAIVKSDILMGVWRRFKENGIELPYPQRVLHHKLPEIRIRTDPES